MSVKPVVAVALVVLWSGATSRSGASAPPGVGSGLKSPVALASPVMAGATEIPFGPGKLFVPEGYAPASNRVDLLVHFHGHPPVVLANFLRSGKAAALVVLNYPGLSAAYAKPFRDPTQFGKILAEAETRLSGHLGRPVKAGRLAISSFSAGYGAVREILKQPDYATNLTDLVLADSLYAGYVSGQGQKEPDPDQLRDFVQFARRAAAGRATMIVTHSQLVPGTYASTWETAEVLIRAAGAERVSVRVADATGMRLESCADRGGFHVRSYEGTTGEDHMIHLRQLHAALRLTVLPMRSAVPEP